MASTHAAAGPDGDRSGRVLHEGAGYRAAVVGEQLHDRGVDPQPHAGLVGGLDQPGDQRRTVDQLHAAPVGDQVQTWNATRQAAWKNDFTVVVVCRNACRSGPAMMPMPRNDVSYSWGRTSLRAGPCAACGH